MFEDHSPLAQTLGRLSTAYKPVVLPRRKVRALTSDYYVDGGAVAVAGRTYSVDADLARGLIEQRRAEYA